jgi:hypothetical protein
MILKKISGQPKISFKNINAVITRDDKSTRDLPYPNHAGKAKKSTVIQPQTLGFELAWGGPPQGNVYLTLSPFFITLHKKERNKKK